MPSASKHAPEKAEPPVDADGLQLLRACITVRGSRDDSSEMARQNAVSLHGFVFADPRDQYIFATIQRLYEQHDHVDLTDALIALDTEHRERLQDAADQKPFCARTGLAITRQNYELAVRRHSLRAALQRANLINVRGETRDGVQLRGPDDAIAFVLRELPGLMPAAKDMVNLRRAGSELADLYTRRKYSPRFGTMSGLPEIDDYTGGLKPGELHVHAASTGELKSAFAATIAHNVLMSGSNVVYASLEMPREQILVKLAALHVNRERLAKTIPYASIRDGKLDAQDEEEYRRALQDLEEGQLYGERFDIIVPDGTSLGVADIEARCMNARNWMQGPIDLLVIDHSEYLELPPGREDYGVKLNTVIKAVTRLGVTFNRGEGMPVMLLHQINRKGKEQADKNDGVYTTAALSYAHEAERSASLITTTYLDEAHRKAATTKICCLKNRDNERFDPFVAAVDWATTRIFSRKSHVSLGIAVDEEVFDV